MMQALVSNTMLPPFFICGTLSNAEHWPLQDNVQILSRSTTQHNVVVQEGILCYLFGYLVESDSLSNKFKFL